MTEQPFDGGWESRIVGYATKRAGDILANPNNWRVHPEAQQEALEGVLDEVGVVQNVIENVQTGNLIDGHLRVALTLRRHGEDAPVYVTQVDLTPNEENLVLASLDPIGALATTDEAKLKELLAETVASDSRVNRMLDDMRQQLGEAGDDGGERSDGSMFGQFDALLGDPRHEVTLGQVWRLGERHVLVCADVLTGWASWIDYLDGDALFCPYPGPFLALSLRAEESPLVMVQPDPFVAGHVLDRYTDVHSDDAVSLEVEAGQE